MCEADSTTGYNSDSTVCYSSNESGPLFIEDTYSDLDIQQESKEQESSENRYCMCKENVSRFHLKNPLKKSPC